MSYNNSGDYLYTPPPPDIFYSRRSPPYDSYYYPPPPDFNNSSRSPPYYPPVSNSSRSPPPGRPSPPPGRPPPVSYSTPSGGSSTVNIVVPLVVVVVVAAISVGAYLFIKKRKKRRNAPYNDVESPKQHQGFVNLQTAPENAPSYHNIHLMSSPAPLLQQTQTSSPAPYHSFYDTGASGSSYNSGISDYQQQQQQPPLSSNLKTSMSSKNAFTYEELLTATNGFSNLLGQGGFGSVFKGFINGREVAVKKMKAGSGQGEREFQAEVETISRVHHRHLVSLVGYCITEDQRLLVYEFVPNQTLHHHLHENELPTMEWSKRLKIALGSAKGLTYLHEDCYPKTIHRDIKAANILLDLNFEPKVADFGLAKQFNENITHVSTRIMGTFGYLAPEYASSGKLTVKSDVFSFGVVLLELITGRRPVDNSPRYMDDTGSLVEWAKPMVKRSLEENNYDEIVDPRLQHLGYNKDEMRRMVACAAACVRHSARQRPRISLVVKVLEGDVSIDELHDGVKPGQSTIYSSHYGKTQYYNDMEKHRKLALSSEEFSSTEHTQSEFSISSISAEQRGR